MMGNNKPITPTVTVLIFLQIFRSRLSIIAAKVDDTRFGAQEDGAITAAASTISKTDR